MTGIEWFRTYWRELRDRWRRRRELPAEYEALAREFAELTARCLEADERARAQMAIAVKLNAQLRSLEAERRQIYSDVPGLTPGEIERLACLAEECAEVITAVGKTLRFGWESASPYGGKPNRVALEQEIGNVRAVINLMLDAKDLRLSSVQSWQRGKHRALENWTLYQDCSISVEERLKLVQMIRTNGVGIER